MWYTARSQEGRHRVSESALVGSCLVIVGAVQSAEFSINITVFVTRARRPLQIDVSRGLESQL